MENKTFGIIGLGLIGGSIAKALRHVYPNCTIYAYNRSEKSRNMAWEDHTADQVFDCVDESFHNCHYIFLCTPVEYNISYLKLLKPIISKDCIITDVGSTKENIHREVISLNIETNFIGGHPMAGSEKTSYEFSDYHLLENAYYAITPTVHSPAEKVKELKEIISSIGAIPIVLDYKEHDYSVAGISHVPHVIASSLVNLIKHHDSDKEIMKILAAGGFKDITRIASSSPQMWEQICNSNADNIATLLGDYIEALQDIQKNIQEHNSSYLFQMFDESRQYRNTFQSGTKGPIAPQYALKCDIQDETGAIAIISSLLAFHQINIKNIGIHNIREFEPGVLKIEFEEQKALENAIEVLEERNYKVYPL